MGLMIHSLDNIPATARRDYFIYLLDYGWSEPLGDALIKNYDKMAKIAAVNSAVVIRGTEPHFQDEVFSWHHINGENSDDVLPAILITNKHPRKFCNISIKNEQIDDDLKLILIPLKKICKDTTDVIKLIDSIFLDIKEHKNIENFTVYKTLYKGVGSAFLDAVILEPNINGIGFNFKKFFGHFKKNL